MRLVIRLVLSVLLLLGSLLVTMVFPRAVQASDNSTQCKWDFPWPRTMAEDHQVLDRIGL